MAPVPVVQQNRYKGTRPRAWLRLRLVAPDGTLHERQMLADTGSPSAIILGLADLNLLAHWAANGVNSNFGYLAGGRFELRMPELGLVRRIRGYGSDAVLQAVQRNSADFSGLVGLPFLRMVEYGGDADWFWVRLPSGTP